MTDIVKRLRDQGRDAFAKQYSLGMWQLCADAADEIERLLLAAKPADPDTMNEKRALEDAKLASNVREACVKCVPTNWHDPLLTGPDAPRNLLFGNRDVEQLLRGIQDRIRALSTTGKPKP